MFVFIFFPLIKKNHKNLYYSCKGAITIAILLTAIIYLIALMPNKFSMYTTNNYNLSKALGNLHVHVISPILVIFDYILFDEKGYLKLYYPWIWLIIPILYVCFVYLFHSLGGHFYGIGGSRNFAYFFLDYEKLGMFSVVLWMIKISALIVMLGYILIYIDKTLAKREKEDVLN